jgi:hypothetical protein
MPDQNFRVRQPVRLADLFDPAIVGKQADAVIVGLHTLDPMVYDLVVSQIGAIANHAGAVVLESTGGPPFAEVVPHLGGASFALGNPQQLEVELAAKSVGMKVYHGDSVERLTIALLIERDLDAGRISPERHRELELRSHDLFGESMAGAAVRALDAGNAGRVLILASHAHVAPDTAAYAGPGFFLRQAGISTLEVPFIGGIGASANNDTQRVAAALANHESADRATLVIPEQPEMFGAALRVPPIPLLPEVLNLVAHGRVAELEHAAEGAPRESIVPYLLGTAYMRSRDPNRLRKAAAAFLRYGEPDPRLQVRAATALAIAGDMHATDELLTEGISLSYPTTARMAAAIWMARGDIISGRMIAKEAERVETALAGTPVEETALWIPDTTPKYGRGDTGLSGDGGVFA